MKRSVNSAGGFSLVELLVTIGIIGILAAIAIPQFAMYRAKAFCASAKSDLGNYAIAAEAYFTDYDAYTSAITGPSISPFKPTTGVTLAHDTSVNSPSIAGFTIVAFHSSCDENGDGSPDLYTWDSTSGGIQFN